MSQLISSSTQAYYNQRLGDLYSGSGNMRSQFLGPNGTTGDPRTVFLAPPNLNGVIPLNNWLDRPREALVNGSWSGLIAIPRTWAINTETAILYQVDGGRYGVSNLLGSLGVDNGIFVWVNGQYKFGATAPSGAFPNEYSSVDLGSLNPGQNWIQILREDHGGTTGSYINITGDYNTRAVSEHGGAIALLIFGFLCSFLHVFKRRSNVSQIKIK